MDLKRGLSEDFKAAISGPFHPILFAHVDWPAAPVFAHTGVGQITVAGHDWVGVGPLGGVDVPAEMMGGVVTTEAVLSLVGVPADLDGLADDAIRSRDVDLFIGVVVGRPGGSDGKQTSGAGNTLRGVPVSIFAGTMDGLGLFAARQGDTIVHEAQLQVATGPGARSMASVSHSDEDQRRHYPGDTAGRLIIMSYAYAQKLMWPEN